MALDGSASGHQVEQLQMGPYQEKTLNSSWSQPGQQRFLPALPLPLLQPGGSSSLPNVKAGNESRYSNNLFLHTKEILIKHFFLLCFRGHQNRCIPSVL